MTPMPRRSMTEAKTAALELVKKDYGRNTDVSVLSVSSYGNCYTVEVLIKDQQVKEDAEHTKKLKRTAKNKSVNWGTRRIISVPMFYEDGTAGWGSM